ncbi:unnamed protein product [Eruca vesicaria subsp. sativa]|uniref:LOB domain-containing protein n=1 Tax=Eruca vesicaria subsp. sativa TaxID=29727 RepID=A0ABC8M6N6_ERUVS|nr:unnamed protein product [Eruca vesicaria subsp. sativa]
MDLRICVVCEFMYNGPCRLGQPCNYTPFFPSTEWEKFNRVHKIFGVENVRKILNDLDKHQHREKAVTALCYEAESRINDPTCGYVGSEFVLNNILNNLKREIDSASNELVTIMDKTEEQENQLTRLPYMDARRNVDETIGMRENDQGDVHRAAGASTPSGTKSNHSFNEMN